MQRLSARRESSAATGTGAKLRFAEVEGPGIVCSRVGRSEKVPERLAQGVPSVPFVVESMGAAEQRVSFRVGDSWCRTSTIELRSGIRIGVTACQFEPSFSFSVDQPPSELDFIVSRGAALDARTNGGHDVSRGGNT